MNDPIEVQLVPSLLPCTSSGGITACCWGLLPVRPGTFQVSGWTVNLYTGDVAAGLSRSQGPVPSVSWVIVTWGAAAGVGRAGVLTVMVHSPTAANWAPCVALTV